MSTTYLNLIFKVVLMILCWFSAPAVATTSLLTMKDGTLDGNLTEWYLSLAISPQGHPTISYYSNSSSDLEVAICDNPFTCNNVNLKLAICDNPPTCTTKTLTVLDNAGGNNSSLVFNRQGNPVISYFGSNGYLRLATCGDAKCSTKELNDVDTSGNVGWFNSLAFNRQGFPVISYYDMDNSYLKLAICQDPTCSLKNIATLDSTGNIDVFTSLVLDSQDYPIIKYYDARTDSLKLAACRDPLCASVAINNVASGVGSEGQLILGQNGYPVISFYDKNSGYLKLATCQNRACSPGKVTLTTLDNTVKVFKFSSLALNSQGYPVISYIDQNTNYLKLITCNDVTCATPPATISTVDRTGTAIELTSLALNPEPVIAYYGSNADVKLAICDNPTCTLPDIDLQGNQVAIENGDYRPEVLDDTDFGSVPLGQGDSHTFTILNPTPGRLNLTGDPLVTLGSECRDFFVTQPETSSIGPLGSVIFQVAFIPTVAATSACTVSIANDDSDETPYTFTLQATGLSTDIIKNLPLLTWSPPADIVYGTALGDTQLNATANVPGTFNYSPPKDTLLNAGFNQPLTVTFIPTDPDQYETVSQTVFINVNQRYVTAKVVPQTRMYGAVNPPWLLEYEIPLSLEPKLNTPATPSSPPGVYPVTCQGGSYGNYLLLCQDSTLTVVPANTTTILIQETSGREVTFKFKVQAVSPSTAIPTGSVTVQDWCQGTLSAGVGTCTATPSGNLSLTAVYKGNSYFQASTSPAIIYSKVLQAGYASLPPPWKLLKVGRSMVNSSVTTTLTIQTTGNFSLEVNFQSITGPHAQDFQILTPHFPISLTSGSLPVTIACMPSEKGLRTASLMLSSNDPRWPTPTYPLECEGLQPAYVASPVVNTPIKVGNSQVGKSVTFPLNVKNLGTGDLQVNYVSLQGEHPQDFNIASPLFPFTLGENMSQLIEITCTPSKVGTRTATLQLTSNDPDHLTILASLECQGTLVPIPGYSSLPDHTSVLDFGNSVVGAPVTFDLNILEVGNLALEVTVKGLAGPQASDFKIISPIFPLTLLEGASPQSVTLQCTPSQAGVRTANLILTSNDPQHSLITYQLQCRGQQYASLPLSDNILDLGSQAVGKPKTAELLVQNIGLGTLAVLSSTISGPQAKDFSLLANAPPFSLTKGSQSVTIQCIPSEIGKRQATLTLTTSDLPQVNYTLTCQGVAAEMTDVQLSNQTIPANTPKGTPVGVFTSLVSYTYTLLEDGGVFKVAGNELYLMQTLDFQKPSCYQIIVRSTEENLGISFNKAFLIEVLAENHPPTDIQYEKVENPTDSLVGKLSTVDPDVHDTHSYTLSSGGQLVLRNGNEVHTASGIKWDAQQYPTYLIKVTSTDAGGLSITKSFTITTTDLLPQARFVGELHTANREVTNQVSIQAPETVTLIGRIYPNPRHLDRLAEITATYRWTPSNGAQPLIIAQPVAKQKRLESELEMVLFQGKLIGLSGTFEVTLGYQVGQEFYSAPIATLEILPNRPPTAIELSANTVVENSPPDTFIGSLTTHDPDHQELFTYSLMNNSGQHFKIVGNELRTTAWALDFEQQAEYLITVRSIDLMGAFIDQSLMIQVVDAKGSLDNIQLTQTTVLENRPIGSVVGRLSVVGREIDENSYTLLDDAHGHFTLQEGDLVVVADNLDYEKQTHYSITVRAQTAHSHLSLEKTFTIELQNEIDVEIAEVRNRRGKILSLSSPIPSQPIALQLIPDITHRGQYADLLGVAEIIQGQQVTWRNLAGTEWQAWAPTTPASIQSVLLQDTVEVELGDLSQLVGKEVYVYVGYRLANGEIIYPPQPLEIRGRE